ncbi:unnamed protein product [Adineta steineri]|uniref:Uncharacterized protein n=1 Tax=Adineta steineri TaxID=433720 RepID=A0A815RHB0_9BILA|nr:unnamed protein product [Adineta steineri]CAF4017738.1 unnamed protein product [Adineta steineri]
MASTNDVGLAPDRVRNPSGTHLEDLNCLICHNILWKPVACQQCKAYFCSACIRKWLTDGRIDCPLGRETYIERACSRLVNTPLSKLQIACIYESNGCREILPYEAVEKHETQCGYQPQQCPGCLLSFSKNEIETHISGCELIESTCDDCKIVYKRCDASQTHTDIICVKEQFRQYRCQSQEEMRQLQKQFRQYRCQTEDKFEELKEDLEKRRRDYSANTVKVAQSITKIIQQHQFATPGTYEALDCKGRRCIKCGQCRDWYFTGDAETWKWIRDYKNWIEEDRNRWRSDHIYDGFKRRDGATCGPQQRATPVGQISRAFIIAGNEHIARQRAPGDQQSVVSSGARGYQERTISRSFITGDHERSSDYHYCLCEDNTIA